MISSSPVATERPDTLFSRPVWLSRLSGRGLARHKSILENVYLTAIFPHPVFFFFIAAYLVIYQISILLWASLQRLASIPTEVDLQTRYSRSVTAFVALAHHRIHDSQPGAHTHHALLLLLEQPGFHNLIISGGGSGPVGSQP